MTVFTDTEKNFIKRAIISVQPDLKDEEIDPTKKEALIRILRLFRGRGFITPRRIDGGKEYDLWHSIMKKLGLKLKTREEIKIDQEKRRVKGMMERLNEIHTTKINNLERKLKKAKNIKEEVLLETEKTIQLELDKLKKQQEETMKRLEDAKTARERILHYKRKKEKQKEKAIDTGLMKCMECGEWFNGEKGLKIHMKKMHGD